MINLVSLGQGNDVSAIILLIQVILRECVLIHSSSSRGFTAVWIWLNQMLVISSGEMMRKNDAVMESQSFCFDLHTHASPPLQTLSFSYFLTSWLSVIHLHVETVKVRHTWSLYFWSNTAVLCLLNSQFKREQETLLAPDLHFIFYCTNQHFNDGPVSKFTLFFF